MCRFYLMKPSLNDYKISREIQPKVIIVVLNHFVYNNQNNNLIDNFA